MTVDPRKIVEETRKRRQDSPQTAEVVTGDSVPAETVLPPESTDTEDDDETGDSQ